jgi:hypothetical protein
MKRLLPIALVPVLLAGCGKAPPAASDAHLRYTVRDFNGTRSSRNRDSVLKTVGMTGEQIKAWANESAAGEDRRLGGEDNGRAAGSAVITCRNAKGSVSSRDPGVTDVLERTEDQIREWVLDDKATKEGRSATFYRSGYIDIIWRGSSGQLLYTLRNQKGSRTSRDWASALSTLGMTDEQIKAWAEDEGAASEGRSAAIHRSGYVEGISRGVLEDPPWGE